ncbi:hypothetical protein OpiT1DRAFT_01227 [Opitutaceae bacterium TAV1]|nr:hypothetical protein OpiT1DRAFT_01227 [Opitutaceae bacterium TAV1]
MLKLSGVFFGIVAAALAVVALIPLLMAGIAALVLLLPAVIVLMVTWPVIWLSRACFGLPWSWSYLCQRIREIKAKYEGEKAADAARDRALHADGKEAVI